MKGVGKNVEWSNETWFRADTLLLASELDGLKDVYAKAEIPQDKTTLTVQNALDILAQIAQNENLSLNEPLASIAEKLWQEYGFGNFDLQGNITRAEMALLIDKVLDPFNRKAVNIKGEFIQ